MESILLLIKYIQKNRVIRLARNVGRRRPICCHICKAPNSHFAVSAWLAHSRAYAHSRKSQHSGSSHSAMAMCPSLYTKNGSNAEIQPSSRTCASVLRSISRSMSRQCSLVVLTASSPHANSAINRRMSSGTSSGTHSQSSIYLQELKYNREKNILYHLGMTRVQRTQARVIASRVHRCPDLCPFCQNWSIHDKPDPMGPRVHFMRCTGTVPAEVLKAYNYTDEELDLRAQLLSTPSVYSPEDFEYIMNSASH